MLRSGRGHVKTLLMPSPSPVIHRLDGLRETGKADRLRRLKDATKRAMLELGYDAATTRDISRSAGVSIGTLFVYAKDKRDLLFLVVNDELDPVAHYAHANVPATGDPLDRVCALLKPWYGYFAANLAIGRWAFREITYYQHHPDDCGEPALRLRARMQAQETGLCKIVTEAAAEGSLSFTEPPALVGSVLFDIYQAEIRSWIYGATPRAAPGLAHLRSKFALVLDRMTPAARLAGHWPARLGTAGRQASLPVGPVE